MKKIHLLLFVLLLLVSCSKDFLEVRPDKALLVPTTLTDLQALADNATIFNITPGITNIADGDFYTTDAAWKTWSADAERASYTWSAEIWGSLSPTDWKVPFQQVLYANVVLEGLDRLAPGGAAYNLARGQALFERAFAYYHLLQEFAPPYRAGTAANELGLPIRLSADVTRIAQRASLQATYEQVLADLQAARALLPAAVNSKSRPNLAAAYALLAKTCLVMGDFGAAGRYADSALRGNGFLLDYNTLSTTLARPFPRSVPTGNEEVVYYSSAISYSSATNAATLADTLVFRAYAANDLRKGILLKAAGLSGSFKGNYSGIVAQFSGIAVDELYLIRAECAARAGDKDAALADLNTLLPKRWKTGTYVPLVAADAEAALKLVLAERRKELIGRFIRWSDLKRLNAEPRFAVSLQRTLNGTSYTLAPGSGRYAYPIPADETSLSGLAQNER